MSRMRLWCAPLLLLGVFLLSGCGTTEGKMTAEERTNFKGGTPPPEAMAKMQQWMARSAERTKAEAAKKAPHTSSTAQ